MFAFRFNGFCTTVHTETVGGGKLQINENPHMHSNQNVFLLMDDHKLAQYDTKSEMLPIEVKMTRLETACLLEKANNSPAKRKKESNTTTTLFDCLFLTQLQSLSQHEEVLFTVNTLELLCIKSLPPRCETTSEVHSWIFAL